MGVNNKHPSRIELNFYFEAPVLPENRNLISVKSGFHPRPLPSVTCRVTIWGEGLWSLSSIDVSACQHAPHLVWPQASIHDVTC